MLLLFEIKKEHIAVNKIIALLQALRQYNGLDRISLNFPELQVSQYKRLCALLSYD